MKQPINPFIFTDMMDFNKPLKGVVMMKGQLTESVRILKELLEKVPVVGDIQITDRFEQGFTVSFSFFGSDRM